MHMYAKYNCQHILYVYCITAVELFNVNLKQFPVYKSKFCTVYVTYLNGVFALSLELRL